MIEIRDSGCFTGEPLISQKLQMARRFSQKKKYLASDK
jgi:hypothetical protein